MINQVFKNLLTLCILLFGVGTLNAQDASTNVASTQADWVVFVEESPKECWAASQPIETVNKRDGRMVSVKRSDILLFVSYIPGSGIKASALVRGTGSHVHA